MSDGMNDWRGAGNITDEPALRFTQGGQAVLNFRIACNDSYKGSDGERKERTDYFGCVIWGKRGEGLAKVLVKGMGITVSGPIRNSTYDDKEGVKRYKSECHVEKLFIGGGKRGEHHDAGDSADDGEGGRQQHAGGGAQHTTQPSGGYAPRGGGAGDFVVGFGRDKGKKISEIGDLSWLRSAMERDLADASKERFHEKTRGQLASIDNELARRAGGGAVKVAAATAPSGGGGYAPRGGGGAAQAAEPPADDYDPGSFGNDDDIPFIYDEMAVDVGDMKAHGPGAFLDRIFP